MGEILRGEPGLATAIPKPKGRRTEDREVVCANSPTLSEMEIKLQSSHVSRIE